MGLFKVIQNLLQNPAKKHVRFVADKKSSCCKTCLLYDGLIYEADDPQKPQLPVHVNCACRYEYITDSNAASKIAIIAEVAKYSIVETQGPTALVMLDVTQIAADIATNFDHWVWISKSMARVAAADSDSDSEWVEIYFQINELNTNKDAKGLAALISKLYNKIFKK